MPAAHPAPSTARRTTSSAPRSGPEDEESPRPYVIVSHIGKGSFATVYKGYHEETRKEVAIKTIKRAGLTTKLLDNLKSEIDILKSLNHRHITRLLDIVRGEQRIYLIMEFCSGGDLTNYIKKRGKVEGLEYSPTPGAPLQYYLHPKSGGLDEIVVRSFLRQLARALKFLHQRNLVHRDIKPQNLLLNPAPPEELAKGHPAGVPMLKIADFGFARSLPDAMLAETLCGSPLYMAPEILRYEKYDAKADLWSVGAVLYEMAVGRPPFRAQNHIELAKKIEQTRTIRFPDEDPASRTKPGGEDIIPVPVDVKQLVRGLLRKTPAERFSFDEFFKSTAMAKSKFPRPAPSAPQSASASVTDAGMPTPVLERAEPVQWSADKMDGNRVIPREVLDETAIIPPSKIHFRSRDSEGKITVGDNVLLSPKNTAGRGSPRTSPNASPRHRSNELPTAALSQSPPRSPRRNPMPLVPESPAEAEENGLGKRDSEYVLVSDTRAVEFNRTVDEIHAAKRRPLQSRQVPNAPNISPTLSPNEATNGVSIPTLMNKPSDVLTFPPPPNPSFPSPIELSSSPTSTASRAASNALARALSLASKKLFGPAYRASPQIATPFSVGSPTGREASPVRKPIIGRGAEVDPVEDALLAGLEELAQKTDVITHWGDELFEFVRAVPQKPLPDPTQFVPRAGESDRESTRRRLADQEAESNAVTAVAVYMLVMSFAHKGIDSLRKHQEHMMMRAPGGEFCASEGFDDALHWFRDRFFKCSERVAQLKTWLPAQSDSPAAWLYPLVYDRALMLSRTAARKELLDQATAPDECEKLYAESLWCLYTLQDDLLQGDNPFAEEDRATISTWIKRTKLRLVRCQARMGMNDRDRLRDARADENLDDVPRFPAPWEAKPNTLT